MTQDLAHFNVHRKATGSLERRSPRKREGISTRRTTAGCGVTGTVGHGATKDTLYKIGGAFGLHIVGKDRWRTQQYTERVDHFEGGFRFGNFFET